jgi:hypothetical protein
MATTAERERQRQRERQRHRQRIKSAEIVAEHFGDIDPTRPTPAQAGSSEKRRVIAARYQAGLPLWHPDDDRSMMLDHDDDDAAVIPVPVPVDEAADEIGVWL